MKMKNEIIQITYWTTLDSNDMNHTLTRRGVKGERDVNEEQAKSLEEM